MAETVRLNAIPLQQLRLMGPSSGVLNFEFVCRLLDLQLLETDEQLPSELVSRLLRLPMLTEIEWGCINRIERLSSIRYRLNEKSLSLHELLVLLKRFDDSIGCSLI